MCDDMEEAKKRLWARLLLAAAVAAYGVSLAVPAFSGRRSVTGLGLLCDICDDIRSGWARGQTLEVACTVGILYPNVLAAAALVLMGLGWVRPARYATVAVLASFWFAFGVVAVVLMGPVGLCACLQQSRGAYLWVLSLHLLTAAVWTWPAKPRLADED